MSEQFQGPLFKAASNGGRRVHQKQYALKHWSLCSSQHFAVYFHCGKLISAPHSATHIQNRALEYYTLKRTDSSLTFFTQSWLPWHPWEIEACRAAGVGPNPALQNNMTPLTLCWKSLKLGRIWPHPRINVPHFLHALLQNTDHSANWPELTFKALQVRKGVKFIRCASFMKHKLM